MQRLSGLPVPLAAPRSAGSRDIPTKTQAEPSGSAGRSPSGGAPRATLSFADLVEIAAINRWKELGYSLRKIREIVRQCQQIFGVPHPLITMRFKVRGQHAFVEEKGNFVGLLGNKRQLAWEGIFAFLATVEYEGGFATRWWPLGKDGKVLVDPDYGFGLPVIYDVGLRTEIVLERMNAGESETDIADDFGVPVELIASAIQFEVSRVPEPR